jgi:hypothetical protein
MDGVKYLIFYNRRAHYHDAALGDSGIPKSWRNFTQITAYPELASHGKILGAPRHHKPNPYLYMSDLKSFPELKSLMLMLRKDPEMFPYDKEVHLRYRKFKTLVRIRKH